ncbi:MAG: DUF4870 family protein [Burkholderiaceae bacterium]
MTDTTNASATPPSADPNTPALSTRDESLRKITLFDYALHIASPIISMMSLTLVALIINYVKRDDAQGTVYASHMDWMISTCWWTLLWLVITGTITLLSFTLLGFTMIIPVLWYLYRMIKGLLRAMDDQPVS